MELELFYCYHCGYEDFDVFVPYERTVANGDICLCSECGKEVLIEEQGLRV